MGRHIGIVLGGGGLLGDFQVGALKYLYKTREVKEDEVACIAGTSVGAINAVILATVKGCVDRLEQFWLQNVITPHDILEEEMWFEGVAPLFDKVLRGGRSSISERCITSSKPSGRSRANIFSKRESGASLTSGI